MTHEEAVLIEVRRPGGAAGAECPGVAVAALADVPVRDLAAALAELLDDRHGGPWTLGPCSPGPGHPPAGAWPQDSTLRELGVLDGTRVVLSGARS